MIITILIWSGIFLLFKNPYTPKKEASFKLSTTPILPAHNIPLTLDLIAATFQAGLSLQQGLKLAAEHAPPQIQAPLTQISKLLQLGGNWNEIWQQEIQKNISTKTRQQLKDLEHALRFTANSPAPTAEIIYLQSEETRRNQHTRAQNKIAKMSIKILLPVGLCFLPAFALLAIAPIIISLIQNFIYFN